MKRVMLFQEHMAPLHVLVAEGMLERMRGLIGQGNLADDQAFLLSPCNSIHTFGLRFPLDIVFLNEQDVIVAVHLAVLPNRIRVCRHASKTLELVAGQATVRGMIPGVHLCFSNDL